MPFDPSGLTAYVNGEYVDATRAAVSIFDHGFLYGDADTTTVGFGHCRGSRPARRLAHHGARSART